MRKQIGRCNADVTSTRSSRLKQAPQHQGIGISETAEFQADTSLQPSHKPVICAISRLQASKFAEAVTRDKRDTPLRRSARLSKVDVNWKNAGSDESFSETEDRIKKWDDIEFQEGICGAKVKRDGRANVSLKNCRNGDVEDKQIVGMFQRVKEGRQDKTGSVQDWSKEQELALWSAYLTMKPSPNFWKKVSKLVQGKSAQDCFDKVHSEHMAPLQPTRHTRASTGHPSKPQSHQLSSGNLLKPRGQNNCKKTRPNKPTTRKTLRKLLQKTSRYELASEQDLFSVLETSPGLSCPQRTPVIWRKCGKELAHAQRPCKRDPLVSPPVLKPVRNMALHEKYVDKLHCREANRKAAPVAPGKENRGAVLVEEADAVKVAKHALVAEARSAIDQFQSLQSVPVSFSDFEDDCEEDDARTDSF